jgi:hypothetical protein
MVPVLEELSFQHWFLWSDPIDFEQRIRIGTKVQSNSRIQFASNESKLVLRKLNPGPCSQMGLRIGGSSFSF